MVRNIAAVLQGRVAAHVLVTCALLLSLLPALSVILSSVAQPADPQSDPTGASERPNIRLGLH